MSEKWMRSDMDVEYKINNEEFISHQIYYRQFSNYIEAISLSEIKNKNKYRIHYSGSEISTSLITKIKNINLRSIRLNGKFTYSITESLDFTKDEHQIGEDYNDINNALDKIHSYINATY